MGLVLRGAPASKGRVRAKVKVLSSSQDILKMEAGYVLVAPSTNPEYTPAILKAAALVTDRGGLMCHAAIIAREMGIPAVVGTGNATQVLKDEMEVLVDGEKGEVVVEG